MAAPNQPAFPFGASAALIERRATAVTVGVLGALAIVAWALVARQASDTMEMGMAPALPAGLFMAMWLTMTVAMMLPTTGPMVMAHHFVVTRRGEGPSATIVFVLGYLALWAVAGLPALAGLLGMGELARSPAVAGTILVLAGAYQLTPLKNVCLKNCRSPLGFILTHDFGNGAWGAFRAGASHALYCLGCCWALMAILVVVGLMNLAWMAALTLLILAEKNFRYGDRISWVAGGLIACVGVAMLAGVLRV